MPDTDLIRRAARALVESADWEADFYQAQTPVEDWAYDALHAAINGNEERALLILDAFEFAPWDVGDSEEGYEGPFRCDYSGIWPEVLETADA